ncbi:hypothetical protein MIR68_010022 [Amoeboaphelidium protococcarum]|nr:hypothetical protein MIR68_010022 [Amoeboaphelidium protococcarum]
MYSIQNTPDLNGVFSLAAYGLGWIYGIFSTPLVLILSFALLYIGLPVILPVIVLYAILAVLSVFVSICSLIPCLLDWFYFFPSNVFVLGAGHALCAWATLLSFGSPYVLFMLIGMAFLVSITIFKVTCGGINPLHTDSEDLDIEKAVLTVEKNQEIKNQVDLVFQSI